MTLKKLPTGSTSNVDQVNTINGLIDIVSSNNKLIVIGDSISASTTFSSPTGISTTVNAGVATLTAPNHQMIPGWRFRLPKTDSAELNALNNGWHVMASHIDTNTLSFAAGGVPDGTYGNGEFINVQKTFGTTHINVQTQLGGGYLMQHNEAISGDGIDNILARMDTITSITDASRVHLMAGTNDVLRGTDFGEIKDNFNLVVNALQTSGKYLTVSTIPPINDAVNLGAWSNAADRNKRVIDLNIYITQLCNSRAITLVDSYSVLVDTATNDFKAGMTVDGVHLMPLGHFTMGNAEAIASPVPLFNTTLSNTKSELQVINNSLFLTGGGVIGGGFSGTVALGFSSQRTGALVATASLESKGDYNDQRYVVTAAAAGERVMLISSELIGDLSIGDKVRFRGNVRASDWSSVRNINLTAHITNGGNIGQCNSGTNNRGGDTTTPYNFLDNDKEIFIQSAEVEITAGTTNVAVRFDITLNSTVTIDISKLTCEKVAV